MRRESIDLNCPDSPLLNVLIGTDVYVKGMTAREMRAVLGL